MKVHKDIFYWENSLSSQRKLLSAVLRAEKSIMQELSGEIMIKLEFEL